MATKHHDSRFFCLQDFENEAMRVLPKQAIDYFSSGADEEDVLKENRHAFKRWRIRPRLLRNVSSVDVSTSILGHRIQLPVCIAPTGYHKWLHTEGEVGTAKGAAEMGTVYTLGSYCNVNINDVYSQVPQGVKFFQFYTYGIPNRRQVALQMIQRATAHGFKAIVVTVDVPVVGKRPYMRKGVFKLPPHLRVPFLESIFGEGTGINHHHDDNLSWDDIKWMKQHSPLPLIVKGIHTAEDANLAAECGVSGIVVSNHGGRQLDSVLPTIDILPEVVAAVAGRCEVYLDGGIRHGTDVFKALALGARAVFIGRPALYGLACRGASGVEQVLQILKDELCTAMALSGCSSVRDITRDMVIHQYNHWAKL